MVFEESQPLNEAGSARVIDRGRSRVFGGEALKEASRESSSRSRTPPLRGAGEAPAVGELWVLDEILRSSEGDPILMFKRACDEEAVLCCTPVRGTLETWRRGQLEGTAGDVIAGVRVRPREQRENREQRETRS